jgi:hypothetical protein
VNEAEFQSRVVDYAKLNGWRVAHFRPARTERGWRTPMTGDAGFPDLVLARNGFVIFAELKSATGRVSPDQDAWLEAIAPDSGRLPWPASHYAYVWRPADWETIKFQLRRVTE